MIIPNVDDVDDASCEIETTISRYAYIVPSLIFNKLLQYLVQSTVLLLIAIIRVSLLSLCFRFFLGFLLSWNVYE